MLKGSRDTPTTATARGVSIGPATRPSPTGRDSPRTARLRRRRQRQLQLDDAGRRPRADREARVAEHLEHRHVVGERGRLKLLEPFCASRTASRSSSRVASPLPWKQSSTANATSATFGLMAMYEAMATGRFVRLQAVDDQREHTVRIARVGHSFEEALGGSAGVKKRFRRDSGERS